ncbi:hypothetical protein GWI33_013985 [Rhynchophorus ferrugineus]|uniref:Uncharacterized protein n=1 Tax=Rhynchophorus ferrugineus TaxID=354439 RepID=A0A834I2D0_RHYFE|nr:hypothetical protein GWI33_013985 [Rhynchophorus ferrugineus]
MPLICRRRMRLQRAGIPSRRLRPHVTLAQRPSQLQWQPRQSTIRPARAATSPPNGRDRLIQPQANKPAPLSAPINARP